MTTPVIAGIKAMLATPEPPELGPGPRPGVQAPARVNELFEAWAAGTKLDSDNSELTRALILLWHDHLDEAHQIAQSIETTGGSLVHGIMHRREPDYGNAKFWFHRAGRYPGFLEIGKRVVALLETKGEGALRKKLTPHIFWDPSAFVDACEAAAQRPGSDPPEHLLREIQQIEIVTLLESFSGGQSKTNQDSSLP